VCLERLDNFRIKRKRGWQLYAKGEDGIRPLYLVWHYAHFGGRLPLKEGVWEVDPRPHTHILRTVTVQYPSGFHLFVRKKDAVRWMEWLRERGVEVTMRRVRFRQVVARGWWAGKKVVVVRERFIEPSLN